MSEEMFGRLLTAIAGLWLVTTLAFGFLGAIIIALLSDIHITLTKPNKEEEK